MASYTVDGSASQVIVQARSNIHDTQTRWSSLSGTIEADAGDLGPATGASIAVDMTRYDAGDFLKNRKVKKDLEVDRYPTARFELAGLDEIRELGEGRFAARARGTIAWHDRSVEVTATGEGSFTGGELRAKAELELDVRDFGVAPPKFLMFKVEEVVTVVVTLVARP